MWIYLRTSTSGFIRRSGTKILLFGFGCAFCFLSQIGTCEGKGKYGITRRTGSAGNSTTHKVKIGGEDVTITIQTESIKGKRTNKNTKGDNRIKSKDKKWGKRRVNDTKVYPKDDFDDGWNSGSHGPSSHQYHYSELTNSHDHHHGGKGGHVHYGLSQPARQTSFSLISFITFASFLLFVLNPLLTLPKRQRLAKLYDEHLQKSTIHVHHGGPPHSFGEGGDGPPPFFGEGGGGYEVHSAGFANSEGHYQGSPHWAGGDTGGGSYGSDGYHSNNGSPVYTIGDGGTSSYGGQQSSGFKPGYSPWSNSPIDDQPMSPSGKPMTIQSILDDSDVNIMDAPRKKKKKKMKSSGSHPEADYSPHLKPNELASRKAQAPDDDILTQEEILQILQHI